MNSNGRGDGRAGSGGVYTRRAVSLGGLFTTLAANNEGKNRPGRYPDALPFKESVIDEMGWTSRLSTPRRLVTRVRDIIENIPRTPLITALRRN